MGKVIFNAIISTQVVRATKKIVRDTRQRLIISLINPYRLERHSPDFCILLIWISSNIFLFLPFLGVTGLTREMELYRALSLQSLSNPTSKQKENNSYNTKEAWP